MKALKSIWKVDGKEFRVRQREVTRQRILSAESLPKPKRQKEEGQQPVVQEDLPVQEEPAAQEEEREVRPAQEEEHLVPMKQPPATKEEVPLQEESLIEEERSVQKEPPTQEETDVPTQEETDVPTQEEPPTQKDVPESMEVEDPLQDVMEAIEPVGVPRVADPPVPVLSPELPPQGRPLMDLYKAYAKLEVDSSMRFADIRAIFMRTALRAHPDKGGDSGRFTVLLDAFHTIQHHRNLK